MFCTKCGTKINDGERFCTGCGTKVEDIERDAMVDEVVEQAEAAPETYIEPAVEENVSDKDSAYQIEAVVEQQPAESAEYVNDDADQEYARQESLAVDQAEDATAAQESDDSVNQEDIEEKNDDTLPVIEQDAACGESTEAFVVEEKDELSDVIEEVHVQPAHDPSTFVAPPIVVPEVASEVQEEPEKAEEKVQKTITKAKVKKEKAQKQPKAPKEKSKTKIGIGFRILSVLLSVLLFAVVLSTALLGTIRGAFNSENIADYIKDIGIESVSIDGESVADIVFDNCSQEVLEDLGLDENDVEEIVEAIDFEDVVDKLVMPYVNYFIGFSKNPPVLTGDVVTDILNDNKKAVSRAIGDDEIVEFVYSDEVNEYIEMVAQSFFENISFDNIDEDIATGTVYVRILSEKFFYICMIVICVLFGLLILLANKLRVFRAMGDIGVVSIIVAIVLGLAYLAYIALPLAIEIPKNIISFLKPVELSLIIRIAAYGVAGIGGCVACKIASVVAKKKEDKLNNK